MNNDKYRVLILDDDFELGELLKEFLQNTDRCAVTFVTREEEFWECLDRDTFDILFLDYKLAETNGLEVLTQMGQRGYNIPTVMMTGEGSENVAARAIQYGALDYLVKGEYSFSALPPLIQKAVRLREMQREMQRYLEQIRYQATLLNNMRDAVVVWDLEGKITYWNTAAENLYGYPASERIGRSVYDVYFPYFDPPIQIAPEEMAGNYQLEHRYRLQDGSVIWISTHITPLTGEDGQRPFGFMDVARDITPRKIEQEALVQSQYFIQRILDTSPNIIYIFNLNSRSVRYINPEIKPILGYTVDEAMGAGAEQFIEKLHPADKEAMAAHFQRLHCLVEGEVVENTYRFKSQRGEWRWLSSRETVFSRGEDGRPVEIIGVIQDITASKQAEEKLQQRLNSEKLLATISNNFLNRARPDTDLGIREAMLLLAGFMNVNFGVILLLEDNQLIPYHHHRHSPDATIHGFSPDLDLSSLEIPWLLSRLRAQQVVIVNSPDDLPPEATGELDLLQRLGIGPAIFVPMIYNNNLQGLLVFGATDPDFLWSEDYVYMLQTFGEMIANAIIQKQVDQALRKSEARYRAIVEDHQTEMICRFLPNTILTFVNEAYCRYYGKERGQLIGTSFLAPVKPSDLNQVKATLANLSTEHPVHVFEQRVQLAGGQTRWQEWTSRAIFDQHNDFIEFQAVGRDITERKEMEEQIKTAQTRLAQAARLASIGELAAGVAHQISNPLTTIIADAQILLRRLDANHPGRESAEAIVKAGWRTQQVINELMKFSQPTQQQHEPVSVNETIENALLLASAHLQASGFKLSTDLAPDLPKIMGNARQLTDLWVSLLLLARSASEDGKHHVIRIRSRKTSANQVQVDVSDNGKPIPREQFDKIFEPQLIPTGAGRGTGMELSICREIVRQNRGEIAILGNGNETTFRIIFTTEGKL